MATGIRLHPDRVPPARKEVAQARRTVREQWPLLDSSPQSSPSAPGPRTLRLAARRMLATVHTSTYLATITASKEGVGMKYKVALVESDEGWSVSVPGLPGCWSQGASEAEALANIEAAIREYLASVDELLGDAQVKEVELTL